MHPAAAMEYEYEIFPNIMRCKRAFSVVWYVPLALDEPVDVYVIGFLKSLCSRPYHTETSQPPRIGLFQSR